MLSISLNVSWNCAFKWTHEWCRKAFIALENRASERAMVWTTLERSIEIITLFKFNAFCVASFSNIMNNLPCTGALRTNESRGSHYSLGKYIASTIRWVKSCKRWIMEQQLKCHFNVNSCVLMQIIISVLEFIFVHHPTHTHTHEIAKPTLFYERHFNEATTTTTENLPLKNYSTHDIHVQQIALN